jgi:hypothetical protein
MELRRGDQISGPPNPNLRWEADCERCGQLIESWRGQDDIECPNCGASYNCFGQRLRDDWRMNPSNYDDEIGDLEGFEISQLRQERFDG